jgi:hypothetical protein
MAQVAARIIADNPFQIIELRKPMPPGEFEAFEEAFGREVAGPLGLAVGDPAHTLAWTVGQAMWMAAWERDLRLRAARRRAEMAGVEVPLGEVRVDGFDVDGRMG